MRIGIMLRSIDEKGGVGVYTRNIVKELLRSTYAMNMFCSMPALPISARSPSTQKCSGTLGEGKNKAYWDQVAIPRACRAEKIDVLFHPKFTVPLLAPCRTVMVVHGADWLVPEQAQFYTWWDVKYMQDDAAALLQKSSAVISVSQETTNNFNRVLKLPDGKVQTIYFAPARHFRRITDPQVLQAGESALQPAGSIYPHADQAQGR
jgi:hypothetical protein